MGRGGAKAQVLVESGPMVVGVDVTVRPSVARPRGSGRHLYAVPFRVGMGWRAVASAEGRDEYR